MKVEWEITMKCNYSCFYCTNLDPTLKEVTDKNRLKEFIKMLGETYPGVEIFVFGGEPFLHPNIDYIVECFNHFGIPFVIQSNFSKKSVSVIKRMTQPFKLQLSIHPSEVKLDHLPLLFDTEVDIRVIDVMYSSRQAIKYYFKVKELAKKVQHIFLTPISDFGDGISQKLLEDYNQLRLDPKYNKFIDFEQVKHWGEYRSKLWESFSPKGSPCLYNGKYFLYGPNLELYNCCYREKHDGICKHEKCFLM